MDVAPAGVEADDPRVEYPRTHFPGTPFKAQVAMMDAIRLLGVDRGEWLVPMEATGRYESDWTDTEEGDLRGPLDLSVSQYASAREHHRDLVPRVRYRDWRQAGIVYVLYVRGDLPGFGGYGGIHPLLERHDRGPGDVLRAWLANPRATYAALRHLYHGY